MIVRLFPADRSGCGMYRMVFPGRVAQARTSEVEVQYCWAADDEGGLDVQLAGRLGAERVVQVAHPNCDVVVFQRPAHRHLAETIPHLQAHGVAVVVEFDDDFDSIHPSNTAAKHYDPSNNPMQNKIWAKLASNLADLVTVTTPALVKRYAPHGRVVLLPNYVPASYLDVKPQWDDPLTIDLPRVGWTGNPFSHPGDLEVMGDAVRGLSAIFRTIGSDVTAKRLNVSPAEVLPWADLAEYPAYVASFDVGLVPLRDSTFNRAKSWLKGLEYAALGVPFVASPTQPYRDLASRGAGDLVRTTTPNKHAWRVAINKLLEDDDYRERRSAEGRAAATDLTYEHHAEDWLNAWSSALTLRRAT